MNSSKYCLDTHALIWYVTREKTLSRKAKEILDEIFSQKINCCISSLVLLEAFHFGLKKKGFMFSKLLKKLTIPNIMMMPLEKQILMKCFHLPKHLNIHDRVIAATALVNNSILITKDAELKKIKGLKTVW